MSRQTTASYELAFVLTFVLAFSFGSGPIPFTYMCEIGLALGSCPHPFSLMASLATKTSACTLSKTGTLLQLHALWFYVREPPPPPPPPPSFCMIGMQRVADDVVASGLQGGATGGQQLREREGGCRVHQP